MGRFIIEHIFSTLVAGLGIGRLPAPESVR
jgi:hypothetical protein